MKKEFVGKVLGPNFGVVRVVPCGDGKELKVKHDDWGYFIYVVDKDGNVHYESDVIPENDDLCDLIDDVLIKFA